MGLRLSGGKRHTHTCSRVQVSWTSNLYSDTSVYNLYPLVSTRIACRRLHVPCIGDKIVVTATCIYLYPRVEHCLELVSGYMYTV